MQRRNAARIVLYTLKHGVAQGKNWKSNFQKLTNYVSLSSYGFVANDGRVYSRYTLVQRSVKLEYDFLLVQGPERYDHIPLHTQHLTAVL